MRDQNEMISVIGLGRVGLITLFHLTQQNLFPWGVDINEELIQQLKRKEVPFLEPEFDSLLQENYSNIRFSTTFPDTKYNFIAVPTPFNSLTGKMDLSHIFSSLNSIKKSRYDKKYVFIRSTLSPGSCQQLSEQFKNENSGFSINYFPEFFREGRFAEDYKNTTFSILGSREKDILNHFAQFKFASCELCLPEEAEILKIISNLFHGLKISFANEVGRMAKTFNGSPHKIMKLFSKDTKLNISSTYLKPGFSFGGPCLSKDIQSLHAVQDSKQAQWILTQSVKESNEIHTHWVAKQILNLNPKKIGCLGCSFTGHQTSDFRDSTVLKLIKILAQQKNVSIYGVEKALEGTPCHILPEESPKKLMECDILILGGWTPLIKKYSSFLSNYQGLLFDLLIQEVPQYIKEHPNYKSLYSIRGDDNT